MGYLTTAEVAELLHVKPDTVRKWRQEVGKGPRWTRKNMKKILGM